MNSNFGFVSGDVISGLEPSEMVEVERITPYGKKVLINGLGVQSRKKVERLLSENELSGLVKVRGEEYSFDGDPEKFLLGTEAERIRIAHQFDPLFAVNSSIVDPLPHQVEAVYRYLLPLPRIRFLLGDDTGAGKTIMTGLLIKELLFRGVIQKILIITPGGLTKQWQEEELQEKFGLDSRLINRASFEASPTQFIRDEEAIFVTSIDFLSRNEKCLKAAEEAQWDLIVVDEAHKLSAYEYGSKVEESGRYKAVKALASKTDHLLFLTATPHRGRKDTFRRLLLLLDEDLFQKDEHVVTRIREQENIKEDFESEQPISKALNRFFLRRLKEDMVDWENKPLFKNRNTKTAGYDLTPQEKNLYDDVTKYVRSKHKEAKQKKNRNVELTLMVMQRRLASSILAITKTLKNRLYALNEVLTILKDPNRTEAEKKRLFKGAVEPGDPQDISEYEALTEEEREQVDQKIFRQVLTDNPEKVEEERDEVKRLCSLAEELEHHKEAKFSELLKVLDESDVIRSEEEKLVIFTEYRDTLESLQKRLEGKGYTVSTIHGGMNVDERKKAQRKFRTKTKIMVATDAAGEGINLQFCRYLINWDIPWNPNRLEQRMGRIHRYGQKGEVWVYNLVAQNTREGAVLQKILKKMDVMREQMSSDRVYDVIADWLEGVSLVKLIEDAITSEDESPSKKTDDILATASKEKAEELIALQKKTSLTSKLDLRAARELRDSSDERRLQPLFVQNFFERAWKACGGEIKKEEHIWRLGQTPIALQELRERKIHLREHYKNPIVFEKQLVSVASPVNVPEFTKLMGPGHLLFDTLLYWGIQNSCQAFAKGALLVDPNIAKPQNIWLVRSSIQDGRVENRKRLAHEQLVIIAIDHIGKRVTSPSYLLNCIAPDSKIPLPDFFKQNQIDIKLWANEEITEKQKERVAKIRYEECELRRKYLETAFTELIMELQEELSEYQKPQYFEEGESKEIIDNLIKRINKLKLRKKDRLDELELMEKLTANLPDIVTQAIIVPEPVAIVEEEKATPSEGIPMKRDDEVEAIAMDVTKCFEKGRGWNPVDVSQDGEHYDIRSEGPDGEKRFIEVKGRSQSGAIILTAPEVDKLKQLGDRAWLYIVTFCRSEKPKLRTIQNPLSFLKLEMLYRQVQYLAKESDWKKYGQSAELKE